MTPLPPTLAPSTTWLVCPGTVQLSKKHVALVSPAHAFIRLVAARCLLLSSPHILGWLALGWLLALN